jgi:hypothetical protein
VTWQVALATLMPVSQSLIAQLVAPERRGRLFGLVHACLYLGQVSLSLSLSLSLARSLLYLSLSLSLPLSLSLSLSSSLDPSLPPSLPPSPLCCGLACRGGPVPVQVSCNLIVTPLATAAWTLPGLATPLAGWRMAFVVVGALSGGLSLTLRAAMREPPLQSVPNQDAAVLQLLSREARKVSARTPSPQGTHLPKHSAHRA